MGSVLIEEDEVIRRLRLDRRPNKYAQRRALDRLWKAAQDVRTDLKKPPLKRVKVGIRYLYSPSMIEEFVEALSVSW